MFLAKKLKYGAQFSKKSARGWGTTLKHKEQESSIPPKIILDFFIIGAGIYMCIHNKIQNHKSFIVV